LFLAWEEFKKGKTKKKDVIEFEQDYKNHIFRLYKELKNKTYQHSAYYSFYVKDPKLRHIHKACVKDRILHHAVFRILYPIFDNSFIYDSYSCRNNKGTHRAVNRLQDFARKVSRNNTKKCFILKLDVKKFFDSIDQDILLDLIKIKVKDEKVIWLINKNIKSFPNGLPLGNITSQLFANIYLNELDQLVKQKLRIKYYIRYCDDFVILNTDRLYLENLVQVINNFLQSNLNLSLHPNKVKIKKYHQGIDFLGYICFPHHRTLRIKTKKRMFRNIEAKRAQTNFEQVLKSYLGVLKHCNSYKILIELKKLVD
jgi:retron-type reverse transcriptase